MTIKRDDAHRPFIGRALRTGALACLITILMSPAHAQLSGAGGDAAEIAKELETAELNANGATPDPWEGFNRAMFSMNDAFDRVFFIPVAKTYRAVTHKKQRKGIRNLLANLRTPVVLLNDILQGEFGRAGNTASRFVINSTIGFGGMGDPAERLGIEQHNEDFGQTLAVWGVPSGPYLVLPFLGPSTVRDGFGRAADTVSAPSFWVTTDPAQYYGISETAASLISAREPLLEPLADIKADSLDYYASIRSFYLQSRKREISNGRTTFDDLPDIGDFEEFDDLE